MRIELTYSDAEDSLKIVAKPGEEMHLSLAKCIGMIFAYVDKQASKQGVSQAKIDRFIDELIKGEKAHRADVRGLEPRGGAN